MTSTSSGMLIEVLRSTILQVEQTAGVSPDDPALLALKRIVLQRIADLELIKARETTSQEPSTTPVAEVAESNATEQHRIEGLVARAL